MDLNKFFSVSKSELISAFLVFLLITTIVLSSRLVRLTSSSAVDFGEETELIVKSPGNIDSVLVKLSELDIEHDEDELKWAARILGWNRVQRGRYLLEGSYSYNGLLSKLSKGIQDPVSIVVVPGIDLDRFAESVTWKLHFDKQELLSVMADSAFLAEKDLSEEQLFGRMYPETYLMYWTATPKEVLNKILREFNRSVTEQLAEQAEESGISLDEAVIMASIIEWEAKDEEEKSIISGLYWNRIDKGMRLQADPTISYVVGERRRLVFEDYKREHPYNTYLNDGLPPGPVTNPSLSSIRAALNPDNHDYLFMVASPDGGHVFTRTFEEHREESEKWRKWIRQQYRIKEQNNAGSGGSNNS